MPLDRWDNHWLTIDGETMRLCEWAELYGISQELIRARIAAGMSEEEAVTKPPRKYTKRDKERPDGGL